MSIAIPKQIITEDHIQTIEKKLYIQKEKDSNNTKNKFFRPEKLPFYKILGDHLHVPFFWGRSYFGQKSISTEYLDIPFEFEGELRQEQTDLKEEAFPTEQSIKQKKARKEQKKALEKQGLSTEEIKRIMGKKAQPQEQVFEECGSDFTPLEVDEA